MSKIGITTTVPVEVLLAAGLTPVDLNNVFISHPDPGRFINIAEKAGFPLNCCSWIKGIYGVCREFGIKRMIGVTTGDCSNTIMLMEVLRLQGVETIPFAYPQQPDNKLMPAALESLAGRLGTTVAQAERVREELKPVRKLTRQLDELTWRDGKVSGGDNHLWLVSASDFNGDIARYQQDLSGLLTGIRRRRQSYPENWLRIAYIGVPPVYKDLYYFLETKGARVVFNEIQRQFAMPDAGTSLAEQYTRYTYPYSIQGRIADINAEIDRRRVDGVIHYVQAFCHRGIGDIVFRSAINRPILTLEGNDDFLLTTHTRTRIEAFLDMIRLRSVKCSFGQNNNRR